MKKLIIFALITMSSCGKTVVEKTENLNTRNYRVNECVLDTGSGGSLFKIYFVGKYGIAVLKWDSDLLDYQKGSYYLFSESTKVAKCDCPDQMVFRGKHE